MKAPTSSIHRWVGVGAVVLAAAGAHAASVPRFPGAATSVAVNPDGRRLAVVIGSQLQILDGLDAAPAVRLDLPGDRPQVLGFRGDTVRYVTHGVQGMAQVFVALTTAGRERLAWPNTGLAEFFPSDRSRLTLDGKGVYELLSLTPAVREFFGLAPDIPVGAGVVATYRFAGEKLLARASSAFAGAVALSPDDLVLALSGGGLMRYRSPGGVAWKREGSGGVWLVADVSVAAGTAAAIDGNGVVQLTAIDDGRALGQCALAGVAAADVRLLSGGRVLLLTVGPRPRAAILDASGHPAGVQPDALFARQGLAAVYQGWLATATSLAGLVETGTGSEAALLLHGADGWYVGPERGDAPPRRSP